MMPVTDIDGGGDDAKNDDTTTQQAEEGNADPGNYNQGDEIGGHVGENHETAGEQR